MVRPYGQEALSVAATHALAKDEFMCTMHRNLGAFVARDIPLERLFAQFQGKAEGFTKGRDRSFHFGSMEHHIVGMISHLGAQLGVACGLALRKNFKVLENVFLHLPVTALRPKVISTRHSMWRPYGIYLLSLL